MPLLTTSSNEGILTVCFVPDKISDAMLIQQLQDELLAVLGKTQEPKVLLDFRAVKFFSSAALGMLMRAYKRCKESKIDLEICALSPNIRVVFKFTGLDKIFQIHANAEEAKQAMTKRKGFSQ